MAAVNGVAANVGAQVGAAAGAAAYQNAKQQMTMNPGGSDGYLYCIPVLPLAGFPTEHARSMKYCLRRILFLQVTMAVLRGVVLRDILGGLWMLLVVFVGFHGYYENMNMTYISCWGALCTLNGLIDALHCILPLAFGLISFDILKVIVQVLCPFAYWLGATFAYHLYLDFVHTYADRLPPQGMATRMMPDIFDIMKHKADEVHLPMSAPGQAPAGYGAQGYAAQGYAAQGAPVPQQPPPAAAQPSGMEAFFAQQGAVAGAAMAQGAAQGAVAGAQQQVQQGFGMPQQPQQAAAGYPQPPQLAPAAAPAAAPAGGGGWGFR